MSGNDKATDYELQRRGACRVYRWEPHRDRPDYLGIFPRPSQAVRSALLEHGYLAYGNDTDVIAIPPVQDHNAARSAELNDIGD